MSEARWPQNQDLSGLPQLMSQPAHGSHPVCVFADSIRHGNLDGQGNLLGSFPPPLNPCLVLEGHMWEGSPTDTLGPSGHVHSAEATSPEGSGGPTGKAAKVQATNIS